MKSFSYLSPTYEQAFIEMSAKSISVSRTSPKGQKIWQVVFDYELTDKDIKLFELERAFKVEDIRQWGSNARVRSLAPKGLAYISVDYGISNREWVDLPIAVTFKYLISIMEL